MFALIQNGTVKQYPYSLHNIKLANPNTSFPSTISDASMAEYGAMRVFNVTPPELTDTQVLEEDTPVFSNEDQPRVHDPCPSSRRERALECHLFGFSEGLFKPPDFPALLALQHTGEVLGAEAGLSRPRHAREAYPPHRRVRLRSGCIVTLGVVGGVWGCRWRWGSRSRWRWGSHVGDGRLVSLAGVIERTRVPAPR